MRIENRVLLLCMLLGIGFWVLEGLVDYAVFHEGPFWGTMITEVESAEVFDRAAGVAAFVGLGFVLWWIVRQRRRTEETLAERVKELSCLYAVSSLIEKGGSDLPAALEGVVHAIPAGWQQPEAICARIRLDGQEYVSDGFRETQWKLQAPIIVKEHTIGSVEVFCIGPKPEEGEAVFLNEERQLLDEIAERIGRLMERLRASRALRDSETRFRSAVVMAPVPIMVHAEDGEVLSLSRRWETMTGYTLGDIPTVDKWCQKAYGADAERIRQRIGQLYEEGDGVHDAEVTVTCSDGSDSTWMIRTSLLGRLPDGRAAAITVGTDVTERRQGERRIAHLNGVLKAIRNVNQLIVREKDRSALLRQACECMVETRDVDSVWIALFDKGDLTESAQAGLGEAFDELRKEMEAGDLPICVRTIMAEGADLVTGSTDTCEGCPVAGACPAASAVIALGHAGTRYGVLAVNIPSSGEPDEEELFLLKELADDIGLALHSIELEQERDQADEALRESEEKYRMLAQNTLDCIWTLDMDMRFTYVNPAVERIFGFTPQEFIGSPLSDYCTPEQYERMAALAQAELAKPPHESRIMFEAFLLDKQGKEVPVEIYGRVNYDDDGRPVSIQGVTRDVSERFEMQERLRLSQRMEAVGQLAGGIAHDFNNILTGIIGYTQLILNQTEEGSEQHEDLQEVEHLAKRAADLTQQLLAFSRKQALEPRVVNINSLIANVTKMLGRVLGENIDLEFHSDPSLWNVQVDPGQIEQVLMNLAVNARDAMPDGGKLTIETANVELDEEYARNHAAVAPGPHVMIAVSDTGAGMDAETRERIFEPFFTTKTAGRGTGLGLSTVYGIVKQHEGNIWVYSEPGQGTTFKVYFPRVEAEVEPADLQKPDDPGYGSETVLIVEDEPDVLSVARRSLERRGFRVMAAKDASEAERIMAERADEIALLLTDVVLPEVSGRALYDGLAEKYPELKVLYMSGYTGNAIVHHGVLDRGTAFMQKPFTPDRIARRVREVLDS